MNNKKKKNIMLKKSVRIATFCAAASLTGCHTSSVLSGTQDKIDDYISFKMPESYKIIRDSIRGEEYFTKSIISAERQELYQQALNNLWAVSELRQLIKKAASKSGNGFVHILKEYNDEHVKYNSGFPAYVIDYQETNHLGNVAVIYISDLIDQCGYIDQKTQNYIPFSYERVLLHEIVHIATHGELFDMTSFLGNIEGEKYAVQFLDQYFKPQRINYENIECFYFEEKKYQNASGVKDIFRPKL